MMLAVGREFQRNHRRFHALDVGRSLATLNVAAGAGETVRVFLCPRCQAELSDLVESIMGCQMKCQRFYALDVGRSLATVIRLSAQQPGDVVSMPSMSGGA
jgi:hypothetical protein